jgi:2-oxoglutarate dehydrogenase E2 component (dihydrolipoamide succinyltransferase)
MSLEIKVPPVGESITEVTLSRWIKKDGDVVAMDEVIAELESDKATFELTAEQAGTLKIIAKEGDTIAVGAPVCRIEDAGVSPTQPAAAPAEAPSKSPPVGETFTASAPVADKAPAGKTIQVKVPPVGESITEVTLSRWMKKDGDTVAMDEPIAELESDKATFELTAEQAGVLKTIAKEGDTVAIGTVVCSIESGSAAAAPAVAVNAPAQAVAQAVHAESKSTYAAGTPSPAAGKILAEKGIDPASLNGNGVGGRITKEDALNANKSASPEVGKTESKPVAAPIPAAPAGSERREKMSPLRKTVAKRLVAVKKMKQPC